MSQPNWSLPPLVLTSIICLNTFQLFPNCSSITIANSCKSNHPYMSQNIWLSPPNECTLVSNIPSSESKINCICATTYWWCFNWSRCKCWCICTSHSSIDSTGEATTSLCKMYNLSCPYPLSKDLESLTRKNSLSCAWKLIHQFPKPQGKSNFYLCLVCV